MSFSDGSGVGGLASCNQFSGNYWTGDAKIKILLGSLTEKICPEEVMTQEKAFVKTLGQVDGFEIDADGALVLRAQGKEVVRATR